MKAWEWVVIAVLGVAALYFLVFHTEPFPGNHEAIGLGTYHIVHDVIGAVLLAVAGFLVWRGRRAAPTTPPA